MSKLRNIRRVKKRKIEYKVQSNGERCNIKTCRNARCYKTPFGFYLCKKHDNELAESFQMASKRRRDIDTDY